MAASETPVTSNDIENIPDIDNLATVEMAVQHQLFVEMQIKQHLDQIGTDSKLKFQKFHIRFSYHNLKIKYSISIIIDGCWYDIKYTNIPL